MAFRSAISSKIPMVVILGATGTGKTKLGVELAQKFATEIISADSMQIYKGLDLVTAKATPSEREQAPHHLLDILEPHQVFTVVDFRNRALKIIDNLIEQGKIPIIVGGTNYYIESIVYKILVEDMDDDNELLWDKSRRKRDFDEIDTVANTKKPALEIDKEKSSAETSKHLSTSNLKSSEHETEPMDGKLCREKPKIEEENIEILKTKLKEFVDNEKNYTNGEVHAELNRIDPVMAARLHPNNRRKVLRSIEVWLKSGRRHSEVLADQKKTEGELRRPGNTLMFWLQCDQKVHDARLDARVDKMIEEGLIEELLDFHARHNKQRIQDGIPPDYTKGVFQTLGFKEFHDYLMMTEEQRNSEQGKKLLEESIENMKRGTRRYARRQNKMVRGRFLEHPRREVPLIYTLDTTDIAKWDENVKNKAIDIINSFVNNTQCPYDPVISTLREEKLGSDGNSHNYCDVCERIILGDDVYAIHLKSIRHMKVLKKKKRLAELEAKKIDRQNNEDRNLIP